MAERGSRRAERARVAVDSLRLVCSFRLSLGSGYCQATAAFDRYFLLAILLAVRLHGCIHHGRAADSVGRSARRLLARVEAEATAMSRREARQGWYSRICDTPVEKTAG